MKNRVFQGMALAVLLAMAGLLGGCQNKNNIAYQMHLEKSVNLLRAGDVDGASQSVDAARLYAKSYDQKRSLESMDQLIGGSMAMLKGDVTQAKNDWSNIADPHLSREVRVKANVVMGVKVPLVPEAKETQK
jgi:hypothetical protein